MCAHACDSMGVSIKKWPVAESDKTELRTRVITWECDVCAQQQMCAYIIVSSSTAASLSCEAGDCGGGKGGDGGAQAPAIVNVTEDSTDRSTQPTTAQCMALPAALCHMCPGQSHSRLISGTSAASATEAVTGKPSNNSFSLAVAQRWRLGTQQRTLVLVNVGSLKAPSLRRLVMEIRPTCDKLKKARASLPESRP